MCSGEKCAGGGGAACFKFLQKVKPNISVDIEKCNQLPNAKLLTNSINAVSLSCAQKSKDKVN